MDAPPSGGLRIHNSNGRTRITGEDRRDIEVTAYKTARAGSTQAAEELLDEIALAFHEGNDCLELEVEIPRRRHSRGAANLCIKLPREMRVSVSAANGRVDVEGIRGSVEGARPTARPRSPRWWATSGRDLEREGALRLQPRPAARALLERQDRDRVALRLGRRLDLERRHPAPARLDRQGGRAARHQQRPHRARPAGSRERRRSTSASTTG